MVCRLSWLPLGRLLDLINRGVAQLENVNNVDVDEADEMLNIGFSESSCECRSWNVPEDRNTLLFSATMSRDIEDCPQLPARPQGNRRRFTRNEGAEHVNHIYYLVNAKDREYLALKRVVDFIRAVLAIIFCRTKLETSRILQIS